MAQAHAGAPRLARVMMIDDELSNLQVVKIILTRESLECELLLFDNGRDALDYLRGHSVDLVLLDLAMPVMDGFDVMARLHENPATRETPVIFLSAYQETEYILRAFELGASDFISKPIISPILTARIRQTLETRRLEMELRRSNRELVNTNRLKDELLSICSHDLRAPLNAIELICQFLSGPASGRSEQSPTELVNRIVSQTRLARRLVENLLDLNRIEEGRLVPAPSFFPVGELLRSCMDDELPTLEARKLAHDLELPPDDLLGFGDREMIAQVVHNLLNNAAKYAQSHIGLRGELVAFSEHDGGRLELAVADDGPGIPLAQQRGIFEKYAKLDSHGSGSGLGLYLSRQMMALHQGDITVESSEGHGTVFRMHLPNVFRAEQLPDMADFQQMQVLVASSSKPTAQLLEGVLVEAGLIAVSQVADEPALEQLLEDRPPALLVVDLESDALAAQVCNHLAGKPPGTACLFYGEPRAAERLAQRLNAGAGIVTAPLNPLLYLREAGKLLRQSRRLRPSGTA